MLTVGIDIGSLSTKSVLLSDIQMLSSLTVPSGDNFVSTVTELKDRLVRATGHKINDIASIAFTGVGRNSAPDSNLQLAEAKCAVAGARFINAVASCVIDVGAENSRVVKFDKNGRITSFSANDKCAAGTGIFLETMSKLLDIDMQDQQMISRATSKVNITSTCVVFAESEVVSMIHKGVNRFDLWMGINQSVANRIATLINKIRPEGLSAVIGGVASNPVFIHCLREQVSYELFIPPHPEIINALGAAILAKELEA